MVWPEFQLVLSVISVFVFQQPYFPVFTSYNKDCETYVFSKVEVSVKKIIENATQVVI